MRLPAFPFTGRLTRVKKDGSIIEKYSYDIFGNPTHFKSETQNMWWERGTFLKQYGNVTYTYDAQGKLSRKNTPEREEENYYDGDKLIARQVGNKQLRFFYDLDGVAGFKIGEFDRYTYIKDIQGNVLGLMKGEVMVGRYVYDAWGNSIALDKDGEEITEWDDPAILNPIRWKSQYYDADSKLYWIGQRWYDPERGRYINAASPEILLENASVVFALNLYAFATSNPVAVVLACGSIYPSLDFYYDGEYKTWWDEWGWLVKLLVGVAITAVACFLSGPCGAAATAMTVGNTLMQIAIGTAIGTAVSLAIGGTIAGIQGALTGHGFWQTFGDYVTENFVDAVVTSFVFSAMTVAAGNFIKHSQCFKEGTLVETEEGLKPIEEIEVGDKVLAYDEETGEQAYKPVVQLFRNTTEEWCTVSVKSENGQEFEIVSTPGHKYYLPDNQVDRNFGEVLEHAGYAGLSEKWVSAQRLKFGDKVLLSDGTYGIIQTVKVETLSVPETTYNLEVEDFHTYFVGEHSVCVHNANCHTQRGLERQREAKMNNTDTITSNGHKRIPDYLKGKVMGEAKSVKKLSFTQQLRDMFDYAVNNNLKMFLKIERWTQLSGPLKEAIQRYGVYVNVF